MSRCYTVVRHDNLTVIARRFGLRGWRAIYDHPWNAAFRRRRPNPDLIHPGDILYIPDPNEATGLDGVLRRLLVHSWGVILVALVALGFLAYGVFCVTTFNRQRLQAP